MTTEELILGHFEKSLTAEQETLLAKRLSDSPEARAMFDQHTNLDTMLTRDAAAVAPSSRLNEAVIAAALSAVPEVIGGGSAAWISGKVAATISAVIIGGTAVGLWLGSNSGGTEAPVEKAPAVRTMPAPAVTPAPEVTAPAPVLEEPKSEAAPRVATPSRGTERPAGRVNAQTPKNDRAKNQEETRKKEKMKLDEPINIDRGTTTRSQGK